MSFPRAPATGSTSPRQSPELPGAASNDEQELLHAAQSELQRVKAELEQMAAEQQLASESLRASEEFKSRLIICSRDCIKILNLEGRILFMNQAGMQALEICDADLSPDSSWIDFWEGEDREAARAAVKEAVAGGTGRCAGYFATRITGQSRWWDVVVSPILDANGRPERLLALSRDITEHKKNEGALRQAIQFNQEIMERPTGKRAGEVLGKVATDVFPRLIPSGFEAALKRALQGEVIQVPDALIPKHSAEGQDVWESCTFAPHRDAQDRIVGIIGLVRNITERHSAEETFRSIVVGTAAVTGDDFFASLVRHMAAAFRVRHAFIASCDDQKRAKTLAFWDTDQLGKNFEFDITDTPCMKVPQGEVCHYEKGIQVLFPLDKGLEDWHIESYLGVP